MLPSRSSLFPYTTLFRSRVAGVSIVATAISPDFEIGYRRLSTRRSKKNSAAAPASSGADCFSLTAAQRTRSEEHTSELQSPYDLVFRLLLEKKKRTIIKI